MRLFLLALFSFLILSPAYAQTGSFDSLIRAGNSVECSYSKNDGSGGGTLFVADQKLRGEIQVNEHGQSYPMHMIHKDGLMYSWGGPMGEKQGMLMHVDPSRMANTGPGTAAQNMQEEMDFTCKPWSADVSQFEPPSDVEFMDMSQMMAGMMGQDAGNN